MAGLKYAFGFIVVSVLVLGLIFYDGYGGVPQQSLEAFTQLVKIFPDGSSFTVLVKDQPESDKSIPLPTEKVIVDSNGTKTVEEVPVENLIKPVIDVPQYSKSDPIGVVVQGYVILTDSTTGNPIKPYIYDVLVQISCDLVLNDKDGFNYCNSDSKFGRVQTDDAGNDKDGIPLGGYFKYVWHPTGKDSLAFYDIKVTITSDQKNASGQYENYINTYKIQVIS